MDAPSNAGSGSRPQTNFFPFFVFAISLFFCSSWIRDLLTDLNLFRVTNTTHRVRTRTAQVTYPAPIITSSCQPPYPYHCAVPSDTHRVGTSLLVAREAPRETAETPPNGFSLAFMYYTGFGTWSHTENHLFSSQPAFPGTSNATGSQFTIAVGPQL